MRTVLGALGLLAVGGTGALALGEYRWRAATAAAVGRLRSGTPARLPERVAAAEFNGVPAPVRRYLTLALRDGQRWYRRARLLQRGRFLTRPARSGWSPFDATHELTVGPPGFIWDAAIRMAPGLAVRVRDGFVDGGGSMRASLAGLITMMRVEGTPGIASGALYRYLAEAVWCPTALLPAAGVTWTPIDDATARATLSAGPTVSVDFHFGPDGMVDRVYAAARERDVNGQAVPTPWQGRWTAYAEHGGMRIPVAGEVEWLLPDGPQPYWRGRVLDASYD